MEIKGYIPYVKPRKGLQVFPRILENSGMMTGFLLEISKDQSVVGVAPEWGGSVALKEVACPHLTGDTK